MISTSISRCIYFWNRVITTDVSSGEDITNNWLFWDIIYWDNDIKDNFIKILQKYINWKLIHDSIAEHQYCMQHFNRKHLVRTPATKLWLIK